MKQVYNPSPLFKDAMKVHIEMACDDKYAAISTYAPQCGHNGRFLADTDKLRNWGLGGFDGDFMDRDIAHFLYAYKESDGSIRFEVRWLSYDYGSINKIAGIMQAFNLTEAEFINVVFKGEPLTKLCYDSHKPARFDMSGAGKVLREIQKDKRVKRAFVKGMRDLQWRDTDFSFYSDGKKDLFFRTDKGMCGGLILSDYDGRLKYYVHT